MITKEMTRESRKTWDKDITITRRIDTYFVCKLPASKRNARKMLPES